jgi:hypothetical protein
MFGTVFGNSFSEDGVSLPIKPHKHENGIHTAVMRLGRGSRTPLFCLQQKQFFQL